MTGASQCHAGRNLRSGTALDVTHPDPLPAAHPLWTLPNAIITPRVASQSAAPSERDTLVAVQSLRPHVAGDPMPSVVGVKRG